MDAERAPLGQGWPFGACPHHGAGAKEPLGTKGRTPAKMVLVTFVESKVTRRPGRNQKSAATQILSTCAEIETPDSRKGSLSSPLNYCMLFFIIGRPIVVFGGRTLVAVFERSPFGIKSKRIFLSADAAFILLSKQ